MKFSFATISAAIMVVSTVVSGAIINKRDPVSNNQTLSQYPNITDIGVLNGTWYLTGVTQSVWNFYSIIQNSMKFDIDCFQFNVSKSSNTTFDALASAFLTKNNSTVGGVNVTAANTFLLQPPDSNTNISDHTYLWEAYTSQFFVNGASWSNFTSNGTSNANVTTAGSQPVPDTKPLAAIVYSKWIDSNAKPGTNSSTNFDTVFFWSSWVQTFDPSQLNNNNKRANAELYGIIFSKTSSVGQDTFNKTLSLLPLSIAQNNISVIQLNDTCHGGNNTM